MKKILLLIIIFLAFNSYSQHKLNSYEYVIIPAKFDFQKSPNQYGLNMLLKYKFQQIGFNTYLDNEDVPKQLLGDNCLVLTPTIVDESRMFSRNVLVEVRNCYNDVLFVTKIGTSRTKDFNKAYNEALRDALKSFRNYRLKFSGTNSTSKESVGLQNVSKNTLNSTSISSNNTGAISTTNKQTAFSFIAKKIANGYLLISDDSKKQTYSLINTSLKNTFLIKDFVGVIYKKDNLWYRELLVNDKMIIDKITIVF